MINAYEWVYLQVTCYNLIGMSFIHSWDKTFKNTLITVGPLLGELKEGRDVTLDNGVVVKAADMVDQSSGKTQVR